MLNIGWFSTGRGPGSRGLLQFVQDRLAAGGIDARIEFVFSNRERGEAAGSDAFFELVDGYELPLITHSSAQFRRRVGGMFADHRAEYDGELRRKLAGRRPDVCVLAGYMLIAGGELCRAWPLLNLHPALPDGPTGTWQEVVWQLIEQRAEHTGAMIHLATEEVDRGPVLSYVTVPIDGPALAPHWREVEQLGLERAKAELGEELPLFREIRRAQYRREPYLLLETLRSISRGKISLSDAANHATGDGLCLDDEIAAAMAADAR